jgi:hypothetical protein
MKKSSGYISSNSSEYGSEPFSNLSPETDIGDGTWKTKNSIKENSINLGSLDDFIEERIVQQKEMGKQKEMKSLRKNRSSKNTSSDLGSEDLELTERLQRISNINRPITYEKDGMYRAAKAKEEADTIAELGLTKKHRPGIGGKKRKTLNKKRKTRNKKRKTRNKKRTRNNRR